MQRLCHFNVKDANATPVSGCKVKVTMQPQYAITTARLLQQQHFNTTSIRSRSVKVVVQRQHVNATSICYWNVKVSVQHQRIMQR